MTFSSPNSKGSRLLTCGHKQKSPHIQNTQKNAAVVPQTDTCAPSDTQPHALSARESKAFFPQIILHCFLRSPNWPGPARRPESETIKNSICIPVSEHSRSLLHTHQWLPSSVCDFKLQAVFHIYFNAAPAWKVSVGQARQKRFLITEIIWRFVGSCLLNTYLIRKILAFRADW